jgi:uncharacterized membrane protein YeiH
MSLIYILDLSGTFVFALSGAMLANKKKLDLFGFFIIAFFTAVGGGTLRDLIVGRTPVFWLVDPNYFYLIILATVVGFIVPHYLHRFQYFLQIADAVGIAVFTVIGINLGIHSDLLPMFAVVLGVMTAIFGGVFRDILCNEIPLVLHKEIYATACVLGGGLFFLLEKLSFPQAVIHLSVILFIIAVRLLSIKYNISLPSKK